MANVFKQVNEYYDLVKVSFIRKLPNGKYRVLSEKGKNLGTYDSRSGAEKRLREIEFFKHKDQNKAEDGIIDLTEIDDFSYSAILRKLRQQMEPVQVKEFLKIFKGHFDKAVKKGLQQPEKVALSKSLIEFGKIYKIKLNKELIKNATVSELGDPDLVGKYIADIIRFTLSRIPQDKRSGAIDNLKKKIYALSEYDISSKNLPDMAALGQSITFIKHILFNHEPGYIRNVINNIVKNL